MKYFQDNQTISTNRFQHINKIQGEKQFIVTKNDRYNETLNQQNQQSEQLMNQLLGKYQVATALVSQTKVELDIMMQLFEKIRKVQEGKCPKIKKRHRRCTADIQNKCLCPVQSCRKMYSSTTSLARHMKLKHCSAKFQPPQPNYQEPPGPNLMEQSCSQCQNQSQFISSPKQVTNLQTVADTSLKIHNE